MTFDKIIPEIIQHNFLNQDELLDIKNKVFELKKLWKYTNSNIKENDLDINSVTTQILSPAMYSSTEFFYMINVKKFRPIMQEHFNVYYDKIKTKIEEIYNKPVCFLNKTNYPGFHIYALRENQPSSSYSSYNFHKDKFPLLQNFTDVGEIVSVIIPIAIPSSGGSLLYTTQDHIIANNKKPDNIIKLEYKPGMLAQWGGQIIHSIEPFHLTETECRITIQMHLNIKENEINIFW
jgi:hypothetical protein